MVEKVKTLSLSKLKIAEVPASEDKTEHRVTFVASTASEDRDYAHVQIETFSLPLKGGGAIKVADLPAEGADNVDIPFITNHDIYDVANTIGSVRRAMFEDGKLIFEVGISSRAYAQEMFTLIEEGHLDNAFSIHFRDYEFDPKTSTDSNGEIFEVSLVVRGSNKDAQVLAVKQLKGKTMNEDNQPDNQPTQEQVENTAPNTPEEGPVPQEGEDKTEGKSNQEDNTPSDEGDEENNMHDEPEVSKTMAKQVKMPSQEATSAKSTNEYLKSKGAVLDFARMAKAANGDPEVTRANWKNHLESKGITVEGQDGFYPAAVEQVIFKAWYDQVGPLATFRRTRAKAFKFYAMTTSSRAQGHKKGEKKTDQDIVAIPRNGGLKVIYKKLPLDWIDIVNDESGDLYVFRERELYDRVQHEVLRGAIIGDGREAPAEGQPDYRVFDGVNGLYSMAADIADSTTANSYASAVATLVKNDASDDLYAKIVKTLGAVKAQTGQRKVLVLPEGSMGELLLQKDANGNYRYAPGTDFKAVFNVAEIVEFDAADMTEAGFDVIAYRDQGYTLGGPDTSVRNWFDGDYNKDVMLVEQPVFGSLEGSKVAAGYQSKA